jgi:catechol 2,3-dioxygenase-like lactoylglutathione lyase family enzyme
MPVVGIGGLMFRAKDPDALKAWYREHLGIGGGCVPEGDGSGWRPGTGPAPADPGNEYFWYPQPGPMVFAPFAEGSDYFPRDKQALINLRVRGMDDLVERLRAAGVEILSDETMPPAGRFVRIHDPEGNPIELWEPPAA